MLHGEPLRQIAAAPAGPAVGAFFDLDGTLVAGFTASAHARDRIRRRQARVGELLGIAEAALRYRLGRMHFERLLQRAAGYLHGESHAELTAIGERLYTERLVHRVYPLMRQIVAAHHARGHTVVMSSSALSIHAKPVAHALGISDVVCNTFELEADGTLTGRVTAPIIWGRQKAAAVQGFCEARGVQIEESYFYADSEEDLHLMALVGHPRPVNPRARMAAKAAEHGWPVLRVDLG